MAWSKVPEEGSSQAGEGPGRVVTGERVARLGPSLVVKGTLAGDEDLLVQGRLDGEISLRQNRVTIGESGRVKADVYSKSICVEGEVNGNLFGEEEVVIRRSGKVRGNVTAPRVTLENGAKFKGSIDMQPGSEGKDTESAKAGKGKANAPARSAAPVDRKNASGDAAETASAKQSAGGAA